MKTPFYLIAALDDEGGIGIKNRLPWNIHEDLQFFNRITTGNQKNVVIMGKNTWKSLPEKFRPLPKRTNIVMSRDENYEAFGAQIAQNFEAALARASTYKPEQIFIIGGAIVFAEAIKHALCEGLYITHVKGTYGCDTFFPLIDETIFKKVFTSKPHRESIYEFHFTKYLRRASF